MGAGEADAGDGDAEEIPEEMQGNDEIMDDFLNPTSELRAGSCLKSHRSDLMICFTFTCCNFGRIRLLHLYRADPIPRARIL
jgi:hypothetical protein